MGPCSSRTSAIRSRRAAVWSRTAACAYSVLGQCQQRVDVDLVLVQLSVPGVGGGLPVVGGRLAPIRPLFPVLDLVGLRAGQVPDPTLEG